LVGRARLGHRQAPRPQGQGPLRRQERPQRYGHPGLRLRVTTTAGDEAALAHDANVFGALALMVADRMSDALTAPGEPLSAAATLSALAQFLELPTIDL